MLAYLPIAAARYAALLNTAMRRLDPGAGPLVAWIRHDVGLYKQVGFDGLPWLLEHPHERAVWRHQTMQGRLAELARQGYRSDFGSADRV